MAQQDNRIKIRQLPESSVDRADLIALAKSNIEKTVHATVEDVVRAGMNIDAGTGITINTTDTGIEINAAAEFDDSSLQQQLTDMQAQITALTSALAATGARVKTQQTPPTQAQSGDLWWDTNTANMYVYHNSVWIQTNGGSGGGSSDIANTDAPGIVAPNNSFKVGHAGVMTLNSTVTVPSASRDRNNDKIEDRPRWIPNHSYFKGKHFTGPDISTQHHGHEIKNLLFVATKTHTSSSNFINDLNAGLAVMITTVTPNEGGQVQLETPTGSHVVVDSYRDNTNWFGRGTRDYLRVHDNTATGVQWIFDPAADGGAWMVDTKKISETPGNTDILIPWGGQSGGAPAVVTAPTEIAIGSIGYIFSVTHRLVEYGGMGNISNPESYLKFSGFLPMIDTLPGVPVMDNISPTNSTWNGTIVNSSGTYRLIYGMPAAGATLEGTAVRIS